MTKSWKHLAILDRTTSISLWICGFVELFCSCFSKWFWRKTQLSDKFGRSWNIVLTSEITRKWRLLSYTMNSIISLSVIPWFHITTSRSRPLSAFLMTTMLQSRKIIWSFTQLMFFRQILTMSQVTYIIAHLSQRF